MFKIILSILATVIATSVGTATYVTVSASRTEILPLRFKLASKLLPGNPLPDSAWCRWTDVALFQDGLQSCEAFQGDGKLVTFIYSSTEKAIQRSSFSVDNETIGRLITIWGDPTDYIDYGGCAEVFWGNRSAWTVTPLGPTSVAYFISFYNDSNKQAKLTSKWIGFISLRHH